MPPVTTSLGSIACAVYLCGLYALAVFEPVPADAGLLYLSPLWGPGMLAAPFILFFVADFVTGRRWRRQSLAWSRVAVLCSISGLVGLAIRAKYPALEARWPSHAVDDLFYQFAPWASSWNMGAGVLIGLGLLGLLVHRFTVIRGSAPRAESQLTKRLFNLWLVAAYIAYSCTGLFVLAGFVVGSVWGAGYGNAAAYAACLALLLGAASVAWAGYVALRRSAPAAH